MDPYKRINLTVMELGEMLALFSTFMRKLQGHPDHDHFVKLVGTLRGAADKYGIKITGSTLTVPRRMMNKSIELLLAEWEVLDFVRGITYALKAAEEDNIPKEGMGQILQVAEKLAALQHNTISK